MYNIYYSKYCKSNIKVKYRLIEEKKHRDEQERYFPGEWNFESQTQK